MAYRGKHIWLLITGAKRFVVLVKRFSDEISHENVSTPKEKFAKFKRMKKLSISK
jgi:hypothetical protein